MTKRQFPRPKDMLPLVKFKKPDFNGKRRRLRAALTIADLRADREEAHPAGGVRLHRGRGRGRTLAGPCPAGLPRRRVPPRDPARRLEARHRLGRPRPPLRAAVRHRAHRIHPDDAHRRRDRRSRSGRGGGHPVRALDHGHHPDRGRRRRRRTGRAALVPAVHVEGPRPLHGPGRPRRRGRIRHPVGHRRRARRRCAVAGQAQRVRDPARTHREDDVRHGPAPELVVRHAHHRTARLRFVEPLVRDRGRTAEHDVRSDGRLRGLGLDQGAVAREARGQGRPDRRRREAPRGHGRRRHHPVQPRRATVGPRPDPLPPPTCSGEGGRQGHRSPPRHRHHVRRRHRRLDRARRPFHA